ncbi:MAG TPA: nicotinamide-nucleotide amidohydrolase family protein [Spirochaetales bacterium]|jgi:nicotinamide-nucleotide amidase|nr:nicotinamide-nucleotide amidohydrolase family protein [Spirochaetales bacterium]
MLYKTASLFVIGTELTRGVIADKHCQLVSRELTQLGYRVERMMVVPDDGTIESALRSCMDTCDVVILTGGLGPTSDDLTRSIVASLAKVPLTRDPAAFDALYKRLGERVWGANEQQAMLPLGFEAIPNPHGTAAGFKGFIPVGNRSVACVAMPGPPREMDPMFFNEVLPWVARLIGHDDFARTEYSTFLLAEAKLEELCRQVASDGIQWGTRFENLKISLYLAGGVEERRSAMVQRLRSLVGPSLVVEGDVMPVTLLTGGLKAKGLTISCAESCTSGYVAKLLTDESGSSAWFWGGAVTYSNEAKIKMLGVQESTLQRYGAVSEECAKEMAEGILKVSGSDCALSITGIAGPSGGSEEKPVGMVWLGFAAKGRETQAVKLQFTTWGRVSVRRKASVAALILASKYINGDALLDTVLKWQYI